MTEIQGNKAVEDAAIAWVIELERAAGRAPRDSRHRGAPADIESPPRTIEVKAFGGSNRGYDLWLEVRQVDEAHRNPDFYVYVVENLRQGDPTRFTLRVLTGDHLQRLLTKAKEQRYYTIPWPVRDYDSTPLGLDDPPQLTAEVGATSGDGEAGPDLSLFRDDDDGYQRWLDENPDGYVVNATRSAKPGYSKLHRASCAFISGPPRSPGAWTERQYIKVCAAERQPLESWASATTGGVLDAGCPCVRVR